MRYANLALLGLAILLSIAACTAHHSSEVIASGPNLVQHIAAPQIPPGPSVTRH